MAKRDKNKVLFWYYIVVGIITIFLEYYGKELGSIGRVCYSSAIIIPSIANIGMLPGALACFWGVSLCVFIPLFPSTTAVVLFAIILALLLSNRKLDVKIDRLFFAICICYFGIVDICHASPSYVYNLEIGIIVAVLLSLCISSRNDLEMLATGYCFMSIIISIIFLLTYEQFLYEYTLDGMERAAWINPNYLGGHISLGIVSGMWLLFYGHSLIGRSKYRIILIIGILLCVTALVMNASRGSIIACTIPFVWFLWSSNVSKKVKIGVICLSGFFIGFLLNSSYFDLLLYRFEGEDAATGNGRTIIWASKLSEFLGLDNISNLLLGIGQDACRDISVKIATHNDFVTSLIAYGFIGFSLFILFVLMPIFLSDKAVKKQVIGLSIFLCIECFVLEPVFRGYYIFMIFYLFLYKLARLNKYVQHP